VVGQEHAEHPRPRRPPGQDLGGLPGPGRTQRRQQPGDIPRPVEASLPGGISVQQGPDRLVVPAGTQLGQQRGRAAGAGQAGLPGRSWRPGRPARQVLDDLPSGAGRGHGGDQYRVTTPGRRPLPGLAGIHSHDLIFRPACGRGILA
jgi:hypothetical protein